MNCKENEKYLYGYVHDKSQIPPDAAEHLERCQNCRKQIERLRAELLAPSEADENRALLREHLKLHARLLDEWVSCKHVRPFLPALAAESISVSAVTPVTVHVEECSQCRAHLSQIEALNLTGDQRVAAVQFLAYETGQDVLSQRQEQVLQRIRDHENSGILTRMDAHEDSPGPLVQVRYEPSRRSRSLQYMVTGGIAAAIFMAIILLPTRASGNLERVDQAVRSVSELCMQRYSGDGQILEEIWMSRSLGFTLYKQPQTTFLKDLRTGQVVQKLENGSMTLFEGIPEQGRYTRLLPFEQIKDLPAQYEWTFRGDGLLDDGRAVQVYDLDWAVVSPAMIIAKKWRGYLDPDTHLPYRIEWFEKISEDYELANTLIVSYPSPTQCLEQFTREGFQRELNVDQVE